MRILLFSPSLDAMRDHLAQLQSGGNQIRSTRDLREAESCLRSEQYDICMEHSDGHALVKGIRSSKNRSSKIVLLGDKKFEKLCQSQPELQQGIDLMVWLPISGKELKSRVETLTRSIPATDGPKNSVLDGIVLEDAASLFSKREVDTTSIHLEGPEFELTSTVSQGIISEPPTPPPPLPQSPSTPPPPPVPVSKSNEFKLDTTDFETSKVEEVRLEPPEISTAELYEAIGTPPPFPAPPSSVPDEESLTGISLASIQTESEPEPSFESEEARREDTDGGTKIIEGGGDHSEDISVSTFQSTPPPAVPNTFGDGGPQVSDMPFAKPIGDSIVPGGASHTPDVETLKKYLLLREQDVGVLSRKLRNSEEYVDQLEREVEVHKSEASDLRQLVQDLKSKLEKFDEQKNEELTLMRSENEDLKFQLRTKRDKVKLLEKKVHEASEEAERLKDRVRSDIRKIRVREKDLESRLEIVKKDSETLISSRENRIIELKRAIDLLEFNMDLLQEQFGKEKEKTNTLKEKLAKAAQAMKIAGGLLDEKDEEKFNELIGDDLKVS